MHKRLLVAAATMVDAHQCEVWKMKALTLSMNLTKVHGLMTPTHTRIFKSNHSMFHSERNATY